MKASQLLACALLAMTAAAHAETIVVTNLLDSGPRSLRDAVEMANAHPGPDTITFQSSLNGTIELGSELIVHGSLSILGPGARQLSISGGGAAKIFALKGDVTQFELQGLTLRDNYSAVEFRSHVQVSIQRCTFVNSSGTAILSPHSGGHAMRGEIVGCTFAHNAGFWSGAILSATPIDAAEKLDIVNSTFAGNSAANGPGAMLVVFNAAPANGVIRLINCTLTQNTAGVLGGGAGFGGGIYVWGGSTPAVRLRIKNSVIAANAGAGAPANPDVNGAEGTVESLGHNLFSTSAGLPSATSDIFGDPMLAPVSTFGTGPTDVCVPMSGSPLIDKGAGDVARTLDQVGAVRPVLQAGYAPYFDGDGSDIGAVEVPSQQCAADFNGSGAVTVQDIFDFLTAYFAACP